MMSRFQLMLGEVTPAILLAKLVGAVAGSLISLAYILPRGRREAMLRLTVGAVAGFVFGTTAGLKIADVLGVLDKIDAVEITLMGATLASLCAWWAVGVLHRLSESTPEITDEWMKSFKPFSKKGGR